MEEGQILQTAISLQTQYPDTVPPLLAFAELNANMDSRNRETAAKNKIAT